MIHSMILEKLRFSFLAGLKIAGKVIYPSKLNWINQEPESWEDISLILILNHTSLFEFVYGVTLPYSFLNNLSKNLVIPVADKTMNKPLAGQVFKYLAPHTITLTRKRDESWQTFLNALDDNKMCIFMPEGQMKRKNGLDKNGKPMQVKKGVYDLLKRYQGKKMALVYSHGLHHVMAPGDKLPKIFKHISADIEALDVNEYLSRFKDEDDPALAIANDLQKKRDKYCGTTSI